MRVFVATSSEIFGDAGESPQHERSPMRPRSPYGVAKLAAHGLVGALREHFGMYVVSGITYNHESPRRPRALPAAQGDAGRGGDRAGACRRSWSSAIWSAVRDWSHAADIVRGAWLSLQADAPGDYVFASGVGRTVGDLVERRLRGGRHVAGRPRPRRPRLRPPAGALGAGRGPVARAHDAGLAAGDRLRAADLRDGGGGPRRAARLRRALAGAFTHRGSHR